MKSNKEVFKQAFKNTFSKETLNSDVLKGATELIGNLKETEKINKTKLEKDKIGKSAKKQFTKDLQSDPDYIEFKKSAKYKYRDSESTFGIPNVDDDPYIEKKRYGRVGKEENKEATGSGSSGAYSAPLFSGEEPDSSKIETKEVRRRPLRNDRKKVNKAKNSEGITFEIGKKAKTQDTKKEITIHSLNKKNNKIMAFYMDGVVGKEIDIDGLEPINEHLEKIEATEATGTGSSGAYETPAMWAKSTKKKDWGPSRKTQYKGGSFVSVKKKCTKFPYCNQGDIKALNLYKNESVKEAITNVSRKLNVNETTIKAILEYEIEKMSKRTK